VALAGIQIDALTPETFAQFGANDLRLRWFDARTSFVLPAEPAWVATGAKGEEIERWYDGAEWLCETVDGRDCHLYGPDLAAYQRLLEQAEAYAQISQVWRSDALVPDVAENNSPEALDLPVNLGNELAFLGYKLQDEEQGGMLKLLTAWRVIAPVDRNNLSTPSLIERAIFVHLLGPGGEVVAQWDGLDVPAVGWRAGDTFFQVVKLDLPSDLSEGAYWLQAGLYNPETMARLPVLVAQEVIADRILLEPVLR